MKIAVTISGQLRDYKINAVNHIKHIIEPNNADVFVYACSKNTLHTSGDNVTQKYNTTSTHTKKEIIYDVKKLYGKNLKGVQVNENEELDESNFGTLGYFKKRMNNQMTNIRNGFLMAMEYSSEYDLIVRLRPLAIEILGSSPFLHQRLLTNIALSSTKKMLTNLVLIIILIVQSWR